MRFVVLLSAALLLATPVSAQPSASKQQSAPDRQQRLTSAESYIPMPTLSAGLIQRYASSGAIIVDMGIDVPDAALRGRAQANAPRLRDALRTALATYASTYYRDRTAPDPNTVARLMQSAVDRTLGAPGARVLLANVLIQRRGS